MKEGNNVYLVVDDRVNFVKKIGANPIYEFNGKYYVGMETISSLEYEHLESCMEFSTIKLAEEFAYEIFFV